MSIELRYAEVSDFEFVCRWLMRHAPWDDLFVASEMEVSSLASYWVSFARQRAALIALYEDVPCGFAGILPMSYRKVMHQAFFQMVVDPTLTQKGVGTTLLRNILHLGKEKFQLEFLQIEIIADTPLEKFLKKRGLIEVARYERFVQTRGGLKDKLLLRAQELP